MVKSKELRRIEDMSATEIFDHICRQYEFGYDRNRDDLNFTGLYFEIDQMSKTLISEGRMREGEEYKIVLKHDRNVIFKGFKDSTELYDETEGRRSLILSREDSYAKEYKALDAYSLGFGGLKGIGQKYPEKLKDFFVNELKPGRIITFEGGRYAYVCTKADLSSRYIKRVFCGDDPHKVTSKNFINCEEKYFSFSDDDLQRLYDEIKSASGNIVPRIGEIDDFAQGIINNITSTTRAGRTRSYLIGNESFRVKKSLFKNEISWYSKDGTKLADDAVKTYIAWVHHKPTELDIKRLEKPNSLDLALFIKETGVLEAYQDLLARSEYTEAASLLSEKAREYRKEFAITLKSYDKDDRAISFAFKVDENNRCRIFLLTSEIGDAGNIIDTKQVTEKDFAAFLEDRYRHIEIIRSREVREELSRRYPSTTSLGKKIIGDTAQRIAHSEISERIKSDYEMNDIRNDVSEFLDSIERTAEETPLKQFGLEAELNTEESRDISLEDDDGFDPTDDWL